MSLVINLRLLQKSPLYRAFYKRVYTRKMKKVRQNCPQSLVAQGFSVVGDLSLKYSLKLERRTLWKTSSSVCPLFCPSRVW
uniref:Uncharacterized protein n=1 Tax=Siphoviridae sp. ctZD11 TaxID=2825556 RepID=A0A8S5U531_9CAUD|nr:MAG TPA: hypothetical protein [Siphoviridae sp. ctZD11]